MDAKEHQARHDLFRAAALTGMLGSHFKAMDPKYREEYLECSKWYADQIVGPVEPTPHVMVGGPVDPNDDTLARNA